MNNMEVLLCWPKNVFQQNLSAKNNCLTKNSGWGKTCLHKIFVNQISILVVSFMAGLTQTNRTKTQTLV